MTVTKSVTKYLKINNTKLRCVETLVAAAAVLFIVGEFVMSQRGPRLLSLSYLERTAQHCWFFYYRWLQTEGSLLWNPERYKCIYLCHSSPIEAAPPEIVVKIKSWCWCATGFRSTIVDNCEKKAKQRGFFSLTQQLMERLKRIVKLPHRLRPVQSSKVSHASLLKPRTTWFEMDFLLKYCAASICSSLLPGRSEFYLEWSVEKTAVQLWSRRDPDSQDV